MADQMQFLVVVSGSPKGVTISQLPGNFVLPPGTKTKPITTKAELAEATAELTNVIAG